jgi:hypothetical protein
MPGEQQSVPTLSGTMVVPPIKTKCYNFWSPIALPLQKLDLKIKNIKVVLIKPAFGLLVLTSSLLQVFSL